LCSTLFREMESLLATVYHDLVHSRVGALEVDKDSSVREED